MTAVGSMCALAAVMAIGCGCSPEGDGSIVEGTCPAISRDGRYLAFQRWEGDHVHLGVKDLASGKVTWVARGETPETRIENACHPNWGPGGQLAFAYANLTNTSHMRFSAGGPKDGYRLRIWNMADGTTRDVVGGLARNYTPCFSPDGGKIYFCRVGLRDRQTKHEYKAPGIAVVDLADTSTVVPFVKEGQGLAASELCQPVVSPNGRYVAFAELCRSDGLWGIKVASVENPEVQASVSPGNHAAYAPNWFPDGKSLVYTGFAEGDPEWCVYILDIEKGAAKRLCPGEDACVSPDGKTVYFAHNGRIWSRQIGPQDMPWSDGPARGPALEPEKVLFRNEAAVTNKLYSKADAAHVCTSNTPHFFRYTVDWDGRKAGFVMAGGFGEIGFWGMIIDNCPKATGKEHGNMYHASAKVDKVLGKGEHVFTIIIADGTIYQSVDGSPAIPRSGDMALGPCGSAKCNYAYVPNGPCGNGVAVRNLEIGIGWPRNVPAPLTGKEIAR